MPFHKGDIETARPTRAEQDRSYFRPFSHDQDCQLGRFNKFPYNVHVRSSSNLYAPSTILDEVILTGQCAHAIPGTVR
jgi:hypothetical protein